MKKKIIICSIVILIALVVVISVVLVINSKNKNKQNIDSKVDNTSGVNTEPNKQVSTDKEVIGDSKKVVYEKIELIKNTEDRINYSKKLQNGNEYGMKIQTI